MSNQEKLDKALKVVDDVIAVTSELYNSGKRFFDTTDTISNDFKEFQAIALKTKEQLLHPELSIAMVGTTSAGKSTIVNSFAGRRIAPMEAKEMSAGVLEMTHSDRTTMKIHKTENATWKDDYFDNISDEEIYDKTKEIFEEYHKRAGKAAAPKISVTGPLEWQANKAILDLPENLNIKFVDLPGLKTLQDEKNLATIQEYLSKSFCIIAMDFNDVDNSRKQLLLNEVKDIVKSMDNTEFLMFILNKVDCVKAGQTSVAELTEQLKGSIKDTLNLSNDVCIYPLVGQLYYDIQSAFEKNIQTGELLNCNLEKLKNIFTDCGNFFLQKVATKEITFEFYGKIQQMAFGAMPLDMGLLQNFYEICCSISGAENLFVELKRRIAESFSDIVIRPAMDDFHKKLQELLYNMESCINISKIISLSTLSEKKLAVINVKLFLEGTDKNNDYEYIFDELETTRNLTNKFGLTIFDARINDLVSMTNRRAQGFTELEVKKVQGNIDTITSTLSKTFSPEQIKMFLTKQKEIGNTTIKIFDGITDVVSNIRAKITGQCLDDFRGYIAQKENSDKFEALMAERMSTSLAKEIKIPYDRLYDFLYSDLRCRNFEKKEKTYILKTKEELPNDDKRTLDRRRGEIDVVTRGVLSKLSNIQFQIETNTFVKSIQQFFKTELGYVKNEISRVVNDEDINIADKLDNKMNVSKISTQLPNDLFTFTTPKSASETRIKDGYDVEGGCCSDGYHVDKSYDLYTYTYDNEVGCYERWLRGFDESTTTFWNIINKWVKNQISEYMKCVTDSLKQITADVISQLNGQLAIVQENVTIDVEKLDQLSDSITAVRTLELEHYKNV
ncbi:MAG: dynamin family protein [Bacteroidales bacterium]|nr:dynamin family protein [Bacteroidales bacterium]